MAITINATPKDYAPVYNKMEFLLTSTNVAQPNFNFLVDIYINAAATYTRLIIPPRNTDGKGLVDIHRVLEATLTSDIGDITSILGVSPSDNSWLSYFVKIGEEYGTTVTQYPNLKIGSTRFAINASLTKRDWINWDVLNYDLDTDGNKFLTNSPSTQDVSIVDHGWLYYKEEIATALTDFYVTTLDNAGATIATFAIDATLAGEFGHVPSSPASLNLIDNANLLTGLQPIITSAVASYTIWARIAGLRKSETRTFNIREDCKNEHKRLIFLNELGGFDGFNFYLANNSTTSIEKKMMKVNPDNVVGTSIVYSLQEKEKVQYYTKTSETIQLTSDWLTEEEDSWLLELIASPEIYLQASDGLEYIAKVTETSHKKRKHVTEKLFNLTVNIEVGYDNYRQRG